jgi:3-hydroxyisobutyrate dehydrogenase-like beta-hydroxyacid dehydrogenase
VVAIQAATDPLCAVGIIGVGNMGLAMTTRLLGLGRQVFVRDIDPARETMARALGAAIGTSPAAVAAEACCIIVCVVDADQVDRVLFDPNDGVVAQTSKPCVLLCPTIAPEVIEQSSGQSWIGSDRLRRTLADDRAPQAHASLLDKDARLALQMAQAAGFEASVGVAAAALFRRACDSGMASQDDACLFELMRLSAPPG